MVNMRFKNGIRVEAMSNGEVPYGTSHCAEIISRKGHHYSVKYDHVSGIMCDEVVGMVSGKAIWPCPPVVESVESWKVGDVVEVFDVYFWKIAAILKVLSGHYYRVRLLGSYEDYVVHKSNIRGHQSWQNKNWISITKGYETCESMKFKKFPVTISCHQRDGCELASGAKSKMQAGDNCLGSHEKVYQESLVMSSRSLKRSSPYTASHLEAHCGKLWKKRAAERQGQQQQGIPGYPSAFLNEVDEPEYPKLNLGGKNMFAFSSNQSPGVYSVERGKQKVRVNCSLSKSSKPNEFNTDASSVGSCSVFSSCPDKSSSHDLADCSHEADVLSSDADSCYDNGGQENQILTFPLEEIVGKKIHRLELHAYRCTLEALFASGPLSWEQETMLTNLRMSLNVSNDEHRIELRNLVSGKVHNLVSGKVHTHPR